MDQHKIDRANAALDAFAADLEALAAADPAAAAELAQRMMRSIEQRYDTYARRRLALAEADICGCAEFTVPVDAAGRPDLTRPEVKHRPECQLGDVP